MANTTSTPTTIQARMVEVSAAPRSSDSRTASRRTAAIASAFTITTLTANLRPKLSFVTYGSFLL